MQREVVERISLSAGEGEALVRKIHRLTERAIKAEAERDAAFAAGQEDMRERVVYSVKLTCGLLEGVGYTEFSARVRDLTDCISSLPIKPHP